MKALHCSALVFALLSMMTNFGGDAAAPDVVVTDLTVEYLEGLKVLLTWKLSPSGNSSSVTGFKILYKVFNKFTDSPYTDEVTVSPNEDNGVYSAILTFQKRGRYAMEVRPLGEHGEGTPSKAKFFYVSANRLRLTPNLSVKAAAVGLDSLLVSYDVLGDRNLTSINFFYMKEGDAQWTQFSKDNVDFRTGRYVVLTGLMEATKYFLFAKSWLGVSYMIGITSATTISIEEPPSLTFNQGVDRERRLYLYWNYRDEQRVAGYKATVTYNANQPAKKREEVVYRPRGLKSIIFQPGSDTIDLVKVEPFDESGLLKGNEIKCIRCRSRL
ncbi:hypothetical protein RRG08_008438 [Elysia crispata]|uniref:Fibronectin type-III domain-containing protein n=1 Tax=Elysia crispata TaxID=231223 RepID=A0AAE1E7C9_9GAST|nr:hypothetical protein RRG08_008438 [Elysia crispata]